MEVIFEILLDFILDGSMELVTEKKVPAWIRGIILSILTLLYLAFIILIFQIDHPAAKVITVLLAAFFLVFFIRLWVKLLKDKKNG